MRQASVLERPYRDDHARSVSRKATPPRDLLRWFMDAFRAEMPERVHAAGVWVDAHHRGDDPEYQPVGGSVLGAPRPSEPFRAFIEDDPFGIEYAEYEGHRDPSPNYRTPLRAALARMAGRGADDQPMPFMARALYRTALRDGDWSGACASMGIIDPVARIYIDAALYRVWARFEEAPSSTWRPARVGEDAA